MRVLNGRLGLRPWLLPLGLASGAFIATALSGTANEFLDGLWSNVLPKHIMDAWRYALVSPFTEEIIKALVALLVLRLIGGRALKDFFVAGLSVGMGFQVFEDLTYIRPEEMHKDTLDMVIPNALDRLSACLASHWLYSALVLVGIWLLWRSAQKMRGLFYVVLAVGLHFIWNSPLMGADEMNSITSPAGTMVALLGFIAVWKEVLRYEEAPLAAAPDAALPLPAEREGESDQSHEA